MITQAQITKLKFCNTATMRLTDGGTGYLDPIIHFGEMLIVYKEEFPVTEVLYDLSMLLDELATSNNPKKVLNQLYAHVKNIRKKYTILDFVDFLRQWVYRQSSASNGNVFTTLIYYFRLLSLIFESPYIGPAEDGSHTGSLYGEGQYLSCDSCSIVLLFFAVLVIKKELMPVNIEAARKENLFSEEFLMWFQKQYNSGKDFCIEIVKYMALQNKCRTLYDVFGIQVLDEQSNPASFKWADPDIEKAISELQTHIDGAFYYAQNISWLDQTIMMFAPNQIRLNPWDTLGLMPQRYDNEGGKFLRTTIFFFGMLCPPDLLMHRNFYIREEGVHISFDPLSENHQISSLFIREVHNRNLHYIWATATINRDDGLLCHRNYMFPLDNLPLGLDFFIYDFDSLILFFILHWLGLSDTILYRLEQPLIQKSLAQSGIPQNELAFSEEVKQVFIEVAGWNFNYILPKQHYSIRSYDYQEAAEKEKQTRELLGTKTVEIGNFIRKLPIGHHASPEARKKALEHFMHLPDGHTFVSGFTRQQRVLADED